MNALRDRYNGFIARHDLAWELGMALLAIVFVAEGFLIDDAAPDLRPAFEWAEILLTAVFVAEFVSRLAASRDRRHHLLGHWVDAIALIPAARIGRLARLLRLLRLTRTFAGVYRMLAGFERIARHRGLVGLFIAWLAVAVVCSIALYAVESGVNPNVNTYFDALWWGIVTLTSVGYGDITPVTPEGRLIGAALMVLGITLFAAITATITSALLTGSHDASSNAVALLAKLADLRDRGVVTPDEFEAKKSELLARM
jgi:voltage-gated potassium channel